MGGSQAPPIGGGAFKYGGGGGIGGGIGSGIGGGIGSNPYSFSSVPKYGGGSGIGGGIGSLGGPSNL